MSSSSVVMMSHSGGAGQVMGMVGGATAFPKLELRDNKNTISVCLSSWTVGQHAEAGSDKPGSAKPGLQYRSD